ncbi:hypothetical protein [Spirosoma sp. KUDC1026]|uniref:hypothetical protein n=1 Tax=Spirosoma sp. KUDC1026 TaxID=2745947 RepID=UPI00159BA076|nr:hypothetical protein [Spirosoma sp. KUDC1026]QKZ13065.1 hypothetical protein HU175_10640 [Spirosoma sp. KUDC1026]
MINRILFILWLIGTSYSSLATPQTPDRLVIEGDTFLLYSHPLEFLPEKSRQVRTIFSFIHTACWRGYIGYWQLSDQKLYLTGLVSCSFERKDTLSLATLFGDQSKDGKVAADWFSGELVCANGQLIRYFDDQSIYQFETVYGCSQGRVTGKETFDNRKTTVSRYETEPEELRRFIYSHIDWKTLPVLPADSTVRVFVKIIGNASGSSPKAAVIKSAGAVWDNEAIRVIAMLPSWSANYRRGKFWPFAWNMPVLFSKANRLRYGQKSN